MRPLVIYHANCWDGFCAAWVARKALGDIEAYPAHYGQTPPDVAGRVVYMLDFSYPRDVMERLLTVARRTVVLAWLWFWDHHLSHSDQTPGVTVSRDRAPWLVDYTEDRDLWRHALPQTQEVNAALRSYPLDFDVWDRLADRDPISTLAYEGAAIRRRERQIVQDHVRNARMESFALLVGGPASAEYMHVPVVNATTLFSEIAGELAKGHAFAACYFDRQDGKRQWSLRSAPDGVDVSEIARAHGGGGHRHAAGFEQSLS